MEGEKTTIVLPLTPEMRWRLTQILERQNAVQAERNALIIGYLQGRGLDVDAPVHLNVEAGTIEVVVPKEGVSQ